jgi:hypothetical protein
MCHWVIDQSNLAMNYSCEHSLIPATMKFCSSCYLQTETLFTCGKCKKRQKLDWKRGHKVYCGIAGEINVDYEIREAGQAGLGAFALHKFRKNEKIVVERPFLYGNDCREAEPTVPGSAQAAVDALLPLGGSIQAKMMRISDHMSMPVRGNETSALFINMSRVNHHCFGNSDHAYSRRDINILVAICDIEEGGEVTFSYTDHKPREERSAMLLVHGALFCSCSLCSDTQLEERVARARELDNDLAVSAEWAILRSVRKGLALLQVYDELDFSSLYYRRTYFDLLQVFMCQKDMANAPKYT